MISVKSVKIGNKIKASKGERMIEGVITKIYPGAVVIKLSNSEQLEVIDSNNLKEVIQ